MNTQTDRPIIKVKTAIYTPFFYSLSLYFFRAFLFLNKESEDKFFDDFITQSDHSVSRGTER